MGFPPESEMKLVGWRANHDWISTTVRNGVGQLEGKSGWDFDRSPEWGRPVGGKTQTGFLPDSRKELAGWTEKPDWMLPRVRNRVGRLERRPRPDFPWSPEWS